nr:hypothetical protein [Tanacetum cinerariifolium]
MKDIYDDSSNDPLLEEVDLFLASDNSIPSGIKNDNPLFPRPPPEPPDFEFYFDLEANSGEVISAGKNNIDELIEDECFDPGVQGKREGEEEKIKSLTKSVDNLHSEVAHLFAALNQATVLKDEKDEEILRLKTTPLEFSSFFVVNSRTWSGSFLLLMSLAEFKVDGWNPKMTDDTATVKSGHAFVQGISVALNNAAELVE